MSKLSSFASLSKSTIEPLVIALQLLVVDLAEKAPVPETLPSPKDKFPEPSVCKTLSATGAVVGNVGY